MSRKNAANFQSRFSTEHKVVIGMLIWLTLLAIGSTFISTPFQSEVSAGANIVYPNVMYLHGLLIGMVGLIALIAMDVFQCRHAGLRGLILWGTLGATVLSGLGGIFDRSVHDVFPLWMQITSFFFLDEILLTLTITMYTVARRSGQLVAWTSAAAALSAFLAAVMGHIAGWMLDFGAYPRALILGYARLAGLRWQDWMANLIGSHSHEMVAAVITLVTCVAIAAVPVRSERRPRLTSFGLWLMLAGVILMTLMYVVAGFTQLQPPTLFAHGPSGLASDDLITGVGVMLGGFIALLGVSLEPGNERLLRYGSLVASALILLTVVVGGYYIEFHENIFGAGGAAPGAASDAIFTWWHQDFAFFMVPSTMVLLVALTRLVQPGQARDYAMYAVVAGEIIAFLGGVIFVFLDTATGGLGFVAITLGFLAVIVGVVLAIVQLLSKPVSAVDQA